MRRLAALLAAVGIAGAAHAQTTANRTCLNAAEAETIVLAAAPAALTAAAGICARALPARAFLLRPDPAFMARLNAASRAAWPAARVAARRFAGAELGALLDSDFLQPLLATAVGGMIVADLKPADCPKVDRILTLVAPLPPRNIAGLGVAILQVVQDDAVRRGQGDALPLCRTQP